MHDNDDDDTTTDSIGPELTRLADGSLAAARAAELRAQAESSPELAAELAEQERAVAMMRALDTPAPASLRARVLAGAGTAAPRPRARGRFGGLLLRPGLVAPAVLVLAVAVELIAGSQNGPPATVGQMARLTLAAVTRPAPGADPSSPGRLRIANAGIAFPDWSRGVSWRATGARADGLAGRRVVTVFYSSPSGTRVGYGIIAGAPLPTIAGHTVMRYGTWFTLARAGGENLVTWQRDGHTCVIAGRGVADAQLLALATADDRASAT